MGGVHSPDGYRKVRVEIVHIACCPTAAEAIQLGKSIADDASKMRGLLGMPGDCLFISEL